MVIEDFGTELIYIPRPTNVVADTLSRLDLDENTNKNNNTNINDAFTEKSLESAKLVFALLAPPPPQGCTPRPDADRSP